MTVSSRKPETGPDVWQGANLKQDASWTYQFTESDIQELESALRDCPAESDDLRAVTRETYPLPNLSATLAQLQRDVVKGRGFVLLTGLPVDRYSQLEAATIYWAIGQYFGVPVSQNAAGHLLGHVKDVGDLKDGTERRAYQTSEALRYHTDSCDIVGLFCWRGAQAGGLSSIASAGAVHNAIGQKNPDLLDALYEPFAISRIGEIPEGKLPWYMTPVFNDFRDCMTCIYPARDLRAAAVLSGAPRLTRRQEEALELLDSVAEEFSLKMDFEPGDMQFLHNHTVLHGRTAYEDGGPQGGRRHLLRLWLSAPNGRPLPPHFAERYGTVEQGAVRGGIICPETKLSTPIDID